MTRVRPNIVWITVDSLRYDHTTLAGYFRDTTPNLKRRTEEGLFQSFSRAYSHGIWTRPSVGSMLTGTYPSYHGLGLRERNEVVPESIPTVPELLAEAGYHTACISEMGNVGPATGLDRGFDWYQPPYVEGSNLYYVLRNPRASYQHLFHHTLPNVKNIGEYLELGIERLKDGMMPLITRDIASRWIRQLRDRASPYFLYVHINGPHNPNFPPYPFQEEFYDKSKLSTSAGLRLSRERFGHIEGHRELVANGCDLTADEWDCLISLYDGEVKQIDSVLGDIIDVLTPLENTVLVITADHGELFGENGAVAHKLVVNDPVSHVPLVIGGAEDDFDEDAIVQHMDVMEYLVDWAGGKTESFQGYNIASQTRPYAVTQKGPSPRSADSFEVFSKYNPEFDGSDFNESEVTALRNREYLYKRGSGVESLFHVSDEGTDVISDHPSDAAAFRSFYESWFDQCGDEIHTGTRSNISDAIKIQLADLGYTGT